MPNKFINMIMEKDYKSLSESVNDKLSERIVARIESEKKNFIDSLKAAKSKKG